MSRLSWVVSFFTFHTHFFFGARKYDLKGSTVDREASEKELEKRLPTLKDNDFIKQGVKININDEAKNKLLDSLNADVNVSPSFKCFESNFYGTTSLDSS